MSEWISVEDRLPDKPSDPFRAREWFKVKFLDGTLGETAFEFNNRPNQLLKCGFWRNSVHGEVTHWMPLPEQPKEREHNG